MSDTSSTLYGAELLGRLTTSVVGRRREIEAAVAALAARRHLLLEGPPGTGKSTLLRSIATGAGSGFVFVEGNAELTPSRLIGSFDPSIVMNEGYSTDSFVPGPLVRALEQGALLYLEEINRIPEETLNVLITVMSENELYVPRLGRIDAAPGFRLVAAMNPFDAIGTARIASAVYDRCCRLAMDYQSADDEREIVMNAVGVAGSSLGTSPSAGPTTTFASAVVGLVRATRDHKDIRTGSSVRGAIDLMMLLGPLASLRSTDPDDDTVTLDATLLALSGRIRIHESTAHRAEDILTDLWRTHLKGVSYSHNPDDTTDSTTPDSDPSPAENDSHGSHSESGKA